MTPKIQLIGVKKRFGSKVVLDGVDLTVEPGTSLVIIGGSGTGKSVTIKSILGIITPDEGQVLIDGVDVTGLRGPAVSLGRGARGAAHRRPCQPASSREARPAPHAPARES